MQLTFRWVKQLQVLSNLHKKTIPTFCYWSGLVIRQTCVNGYWQYEMATTNLEWLHVVNVLQSIAVVWTYSVWCSCGTRGLNAFQVGIHRNPLCSEQTIRRSYQRLPSLAFCPKNRTKRIMKQTPKHEAQAADAFETLHSGLPMEKDVVIPLSSLTE